MEQLLQQAGTERTVDVFNVALKQSQACGLMTPTLVRGKEGGAYCERGSKVRPQLQATVSLSHPGHHQVALWTTMPCPEETGVRRPLGAFLYQVWTGR